MVEIEEVLWRARKFGILLSPSKSTFGASETEYLGYVITDKGISPGRDKTKAILSIEPPKTKAEIRKFLGMVSYFRRYLFLSKIAQPLYALTSEKNAWKKGELPI